MTLGSSWGKKAADKGKTGNDFMLKESEEASAYVFL